MATPENKPMSYYVFSETPYRGAPMLGIGDGLRNLLHAKPFGPEAHVEVSIDEDQLDRVESLDWRDYLIAPQPIVSERLKDTMHGLVAEVCQFVEVEFTNAKVDKAYYAVNPLGLIDRCLDRERSDYRADSRGNISRVRSAVLDEPYLEEHLEPQQLTLFQSRYPMMMICAESLKLAIESIEPTGLRLFPVEEWNSNIVFQMAKEERRKRRK